MYLRSLSSRSSVLIRGDHGSLQSEEHHGEPSPERCLRLSPLVGDTPNGPSVKEVSLNEVQISFFELGQLGDSRGHEVSLIHKTEFAVIVS